MRCLAHTERLAVEMLGNCIADPDVRDRFLGDLGKSTVEETAPDSSRLLFHIDGFKCDPCQGQDSFRGTDGFPVEGTLTDSDGAAVEVYLYHVDGRIFELELLRPDAHHIVEPRWETFRVK